MPIYNPNTGFTITSSSGSKQDIGNRYITEDYMIDAYPTIAAQSFLGPQKLPGLWCWGQGSLGQVPDGIGSTRSSPVQIGLLTDWTQVSCGYSHAMSIKTDGTLWAWGTGDRPSAAGPFNGELGNGVNGFVSYYSPVQIGSNTNWKQVSSGYYHNLSIKNDGTLWTWGKNDHGQLGLGATPLGKDFTNRVDPSLAPSPVQIAGGTTWSKTYANTQVLSYSYGGRHSLFVSSTGTLWACGYNVQGQLGLGVTHNNRQNMYYLSPIQVGALTNWKQVGVCYDISAALKTDGTIWTWGYNSSGGLGNGTTIDYSSPIQIGANTAWTQIAAGGGSGSGQIAAIKGGELWTWGYNNRGQLGNGNSLNYSSPIQVGLLTNWKQVSVGGNQYICAVKTDGTLWAWGYNLYGQLGVGNAINYSSPVQVGTNTNWSSVFCGYASTYAIKTTGTLWAWGENGGGQLGININYTPYNSPIQVGLLTNWRQVATSGAAMAAVKTDGTLWTCGYNGQGQLGLGKNAITTDGNTANFYFSPIQIGSNTYWTQVSSGFRCFHGYTNTGTTYACGDNYYGQLGAAIEFNSPYSSPVQVGALTNWKQVSCGYFSSAAIKTDGTLWTWGGNQYGTLGNNTSQNSTFLVYSYYSSPIQIGSLTNWKQVSVGRDTMGAIKTDGTLWMWGLNNEGQLGIDSIIDNYSSPIQVGSLTNWKQIYCGYTTVAAIKTDGTLWTWGRNLTGQLGNGTTINYSSPIQVGSLTNWKKVQVTGYSAATLTVVTALKTDGTLWTWGSNQYGSLGLNVFTSLSYSSPVQVSALNSWKDISGGPGYFVSAVQDSTY